ncbi:MAG: hypothetical protein H6913_07510 [Altererythrobacter sp.]|nr:hypothetical protein [Altererythrobacter sp.]
MQDWEFEVADANRIDEFLSAYQSQELTDDERFTLMEMIIQSFEDLGNLCRPTIDGSQRSIFSMRISGCTLTQSGTGHVLKSQAAGIYFCVAINSGFVAEAFCRSNKVKIAPLRYFLPNPSIGATFHWSPTPLPQSCGNPSP